MARADWDAGTENDQTYSWLPDDGNHFLQFGGAEGTFADFFHNGKVDLLDHGFEFSVKRLTSSPLLPVYVSLRAQGLVRSTLDCYRVRVSAYAEFGEVEILRVTAGVEVSLYQWDEVPFVADVWNRVHVDVYDDENGGPNVTIHVYLWVDGAWVHQAGVGDSEGSLRGVPGRAAFGSAGVHPLNLIQIDNVRICTCLPPP